jgi:hypothetical protein
LKSGSLRLLEEPAQACNGSAFNFLFQMAFSEMFSHQIFLWDFVSLSYPHNQRLHSFLDFTSLTVTRVTVILNVHVVRPLLYCHACAHCS